MNQSLQPLTRCLASIIEADRGGGPTAEVIVLANGASSDVVEALSRRQDIVLARSDVNHGFAGGCNWVARFARGEYLAFLNDDVVVTPGWLSKLVVAMERNVLVGVAAGRVIRPDGLLQEAGSIVWRDGSVWGLGRLLGADDPRFLEPRDVDYVSFCAALVRRQAWSDLGGFDERYFPAYYEDIDLCLRARARGWRILCDPASVVIHSEGSSTSPRYRRFLSERNRIQFVSKWLDYLTELPLRPLDERPARMSIAALLALKNRPADGISSHQGGETSSAASSREIPARGREAWFDAEVDEAGAVALERRHLQAELEVLKDYARCLADELDTVTTGVLARRRYLALRAALVRRVRRVTVWPVTHSIAQRSHRKG